MRWKQTFQRPDIDRWSKTTSTDSTVKLICCHCNPELKIGLMHPSAIVLTVCKVCEHTQAQTHIRKKDKSIFNVYSKLNRRCFIVNIGKVIAVGPVNNWLHERQVLTSFCGFY